MSENYYPVHLFPPLLYKFEYNFCWSNLKDKVENLISLVEINSKLEKGNAISTVSLPWHLQPHLWQEFQDFNITLKNILNDIKKQFEFVDMNSDITQSWINRHGSSGETLEHSHGSTLFAIAAYLYCPLNSGNIVFRDPLEYHKHSFPVFAEESGFKEVEVCTNDVLIFPGWLKHYVKPNQTNEDRFVLTLNIS